MLFSVVLIYISIKNCTIVSEAIR